LQSCGGPYIRNSLIPARNAFPDHYVALTGLQQQHERFAAATWDNNLRLQQYEEAFTDKCILG